MEISIKAIGYNVGTSGWLLSGLADGSITISEGLTKDGRHALWIKSGSKSACLAIYDEYNLSNTQYSGTIGYAVVDDWSEAVLNYLYLTDAASNALLGAAQDWVEQAAAARSADETVEIKAIRV